MVVIAFPATDVKEVVAACHASRYNKLWLLRTSTSVMLSTPDLTTFAIPCYLSSGCADVFGDSAQPNVDPISVFHKTLKLLHSMAGRRARDVMVEIQFRDREFRVCLTASGDGGDSV